MIPVRLPRTRPTQGFSLIELMVSLAIGLVLTLAITTLLARNEANRRGLNTSNDMEATGAYLSMQLDRSLRSAGSGFVHRWDTSFGCALLAARDATVVLPVPAAQATKLGAPFSGLPLNVRLAPVVIHSNAAGNTTAGGNGDVLAIMAGAGGVAEVARDVLPGSVSSNGLRLANTLGMRGGDLVTVMQPDVGCMVQQVTSGFTGSTDQALPLAGDDYAAATIGSTNLADYKYADGTQMMELGNPVDRPAQYNWIGVGPNDALLSYDLLQLNGRDTALPLAEGVTVMRAVYGVDTTGDGRLDEWHDAATAPYDAASLLAATKPARDTLHSIVAVRVALILSSTLVERDTAPVATSFTLFGDLPDVSVTVDLSKRTDFTTQKKRRHRVFEFTVPLRNAMIDNAK